MKQQADQQRVEREFQVDDMVFLRLQPYRQKYLKNKRPIKIGPKILWSIQGVTVHWPNSI